jgi:hypothetical protein
MNIGFLKSWHAILYAIPFAPEFYKCSRRDLGEAFVEMLIMTFFSTMPLWIMPLVGPIIFRTQVSFVENVLSTIKGGELFVYCAALVGPLIYIITRRYGEVENKNGRFSLAIAFPHGVAFVLFSALICVFAGFAFSLMRNPIFAANDAAVQLNVTGIFWASIAIYIFSLYCFFSASAYRNAMTGFVQNTHVEEDRFAIAWENRSNGQ